MLGWTELNILAEGWDHANEEESEGGEELSVLFIAYPLLTMPPVTYCRGQKSSKSRT